MSDIELATGGVKPDAIGASMQQLRPVAQKAAQRLLADPCGFVHKSIATVAARARVSQPTLRRGTSPHDGIQQAIATLDRGRHVGFSGSGASGALQHHDLVYLSGVTLSLYTERGRARLCEALAEARAAGRRVAFDGNCRPRGWCDAGAAHAAFDAVLRRVDIVLPTFDDERMLYGDGSVEECARRYLAAGTAEVVLEDGGRACLLADGRDLRGSLPADGTEDVS